MFSLLKFDYFVLSQLSILAFKDNELVLHVTGHGSIPSLSRIAMSESLNIWQ